MRKLQHDQIISELNKIGITLTSYKLGPMGKYNVAMAKTPSGNGLRGWFPDNATVEISTDKKAKQAVLKVTEEARKVPSESASHKNWDGEFIEGNETFSDFKKRSPEYQRPIGRGYVPNAVFVPTQVVRRNRGGTNRWYFKGYWRTRKNTTYFLVGVDERKHFISVLKNPVNTVREAHRELRPKGLSSKAVRQGEWFFDPVTSERKALDIFTCGTIKTYEEPLEPGSSHVCNRIISYKKDKYVIGKIRDRRKGYHKTLELSTLHRVVRNNEKELQNVRNYD